MPTWIVCLVLAIGVTTWLYNYLAKHNGNASPKSNLTAASVAGAIVFIVIFSLLKVVLHLN